MTTPSTPTDAVNTVLAENPMSTHAIATESLIDGLELRWLDSNGQDKSVSVASTPIKIGSGPKCEIRLFGKRLKPLHAVVSRGQEGLVIRRWSADTLLNGEAFQESLLSHGDRLTIGSDSTDSIQIEVASQFDTEIPNDTPATEELQQPFTEQSSLVENLVSEEANIEEAIEPASYEAPQQEAIEPQEINLTIDETELDSEVDLHHPTLEDQPTDVWAIESYSDQDSLLGVEESSNDVLDHGPESTETWRSEDELAPEAKVQEATSVEISIDEPAETPAETPADQGAEQLAEQVEQSVPVISHVVEVTSQVSRERLTSNYLRVKRLLTALRADRAVIVETNHKIELFSEQLDLLHQQMTDSSAENAALNDRIAELESQLEASYGNPESIDDQEAPTLSILAQAAETVAMPVEDDTFAHEESTFVESAQDVIDSTPIDEPTIPEMVEEVPQDADLNEQWDLEQQFAAEFQQAEFQQAEFQQAEFQQAESQQAESQQAESQQAESQQAESQQAEPQQAESLENVEMPGDESDENNSFEAPIGLSEANDVDLPVGSLLAEFQQESLEQEDRNSVEPIQSIDESEDASNEPFEPASFIEQFSHLVPEEENNPVEAAETLQELNAQALVAPIEATSNPDVESNGSEDDESVDDYMAKMMARIRGEAVPETAPISKNQSSKSKSQPSNLKNKVTVGSDEQEKEVPKGPPITNLAELKGNTAAEVHTDMAALRSLANTSARDAIEIARSRQWKEKVTSKIAVIGLGFGGSVIGLITSPNLFGFQFLLSACFATMWSYIGLQSLLKAQADVTLDVDLSHAKAEAQEATA